MKRYLPLLLMLSAPALTSAQSYERNSLPCTVEVCIGDGLPQLGKIKWDRAKNAFSLGGKPDYVGSHPVDAREIETLKQTYRGDVTKAAGYLSYEVFDDKALPLLSAVTACTKHELQGTFTTQDGNPTNVKIELVPDEGDPAIQHWIVTLISRTFPAAITAAQKAEVRKTLDERYGRFSFSRGIQRGVHATYDARDDALKPGGYSFSLSWIGPRDEFDRIARNPACGGSQKVSVD